MCSTSADRRISTLLQGFSFRRQPRDRALRTVLPQGQGVGSDDLGSLPGGLGAVGGTGAVAFVHARRPAEEGVAEDVDILFQSGGSLTAFYLAGP